VHLTLRYALTLLITLTFLIEYNRHVNSLMLGLGFESILSKMTGNNFNWFLHVMIFMHTLEVIKKQEEKRMKDENEDEEAEAENE
jgi:preprotein translocase subunit SecG